MRKSTSWLYVLSALTIFSLTGCKDEACGNGAIDPGETCDGNCPTECSDNNACTDDALTGSADECSAACTFTPKLECTGGDGCCPAGCNSSSDNDCSTTCGDGIVDSGETCDGDCRANCNDGNSCTNDVQTGSATTCSFDCAYNAIVACAGGDGCCPSGCNAESDDDCSATCGNNTIDTGETCDGDCPTDCNDNNACTADVLTGSADNCSADCSNQPVLVCADDDGCCPSSCNPSNDNDCTNCGDGVVDPGETCDPPGSCPTECDNSNPCSPQTLEGDPMRCNVECISSDIQICASGDMCCPSGCSEANDDDCAPQIDIGTPCTMNSDCQNGLCCDGSGACEFAFPGGYCSQWCLEGDSCPAGSHCLFGTVCVRDCTENGDCGRADYVCRDVGNDGVTECVAP